MIFSWVGWGKMNMVGNQMRSCLFLAVMHYNENAGRLQKKNKKGTQEFTINFPKYKKGGYIVLKGLNRL